MGASGWTLLNQVMSRLGLAAFLFSLVTACLAPGGLRTNETGGEPPRAPEASAGFWGGKCRPSPVVRQEVEAGTYLMAVGGDLAGSPFLELVAGQPHKTQWARRNEPPQPRLPLRAKRLDGPAPTVEFEAFGHSNLYPGLSEEWGAGHGYAYNLTLPTAGCWRITVANGRPADFVVYEVKAPETGR